MMKITAIILAGGKNRRLGRIKALEPVGNQRLIERVLAKLKPISSQILIVTSLEQPDLAIDGEAEILTDHYSAKGPLGGIYTGLLSSQSDYNLVVACDMPFLNQGLLGYMLRFTENYDLILPRSDNLVEPLHAIYSKNCLVYIEYLLKEDRLQILELLNMVKVRYIEADEINRVDPEHLSFFNINTEADLAKANELARAEAQT